MFSVVVVPGGAGAVVMAGLTMWSAKEKDFICVGDGVLLADTGDTIGGRVLSGAGAGGNMSGGMARCCARFFSDDLGAAAAAVDVDVGVTGELAVAVAGAVEAEGGMAVAAAAAAADGNPLLKRSCEGTAARGIHGGLAETAAAAAAAAAYAETRAAAKA